MLMITERVLESIVLFAALRTGVHLLGLPWGDGKGAELRAEVRRRPLPVAAIALTVLLAVGFIVSLAWPGALHELSQPGESDSTWQVFTAPFMQEGAIGGVWNVITGFAVLVLAEWAWGPVLAALIWLTGAWAPVGDLAALAGYHVSQSDVAAYSAGSSGATYFTAASLCGALLVSGAGRSRLAALATPAIGLVMWLATNDGHGVMVVLGFLAGVILAGLCALARGRRPAREDSQARAACGPAAAAEALR
jgi:hypothetical protein